ncbi:hypothetical protein PV325_007306, partial [Microctonus aethiopoides]
MAILSISRKKAYCDHSLAREEWTFFDELDDYHFKRRFLSFITTMIWWYRNSNEMHHILYIGWFNILTVTVTLLELADFSPVFWVFDAHAMWHASTAPLVYLLY